MGDNGIVKERAQHNVDKEKFDSGHSRIFGERIRVTCTNESCALSSRQKLEGYFDCPHCGVRNVWFKDHFKPVEGE